MQVSAKGKSLTVTFDGTNVEIKPIGGAGKLGKMLRTSVATYKEPESLVDELDGPKREALLAALSRNSALLSPVLDAIRIENADVYAQARSICPDDQGQMLMEAVRISSKGVAASIAKHKSEIGKALRNSSETVDVLLSTYIPVQDLEAVELTDEQRPRLRFIERDGNEHAVVLAGDKSADVEALVSAVKQRISEVTSPGKAEQGLGIDDLEKLHSLLEKGIISSEDFETKKRQILGLDS